MTETIDQDKVHYAYFGRLPHDRPGSDGGGPDHDGVITAAYRFLSEREMDVAFAFCMPGDTFRKKEAHKWARPRLLYGSGLRRCKKAGVHIRARWKTILQQEEKPLEAICRVFNLTVCPVCVPRTFKDWVLVPGANTRGRERPEPDVDSSEPGPTVEDQA